MAKRQAFTEWATRGDERRNTATHGHGISLGAFRTALVLGNLCSAWTRRVRFPGVRALGGSSARRLGGLTGRQLTGPVVDAPEVNLRQSAQSDHKTELAARSPGGADANSIFFCRWKFPQKKILRNTRFLSGGVTGPVSRRAATPTSHRADEPPSARAPGNRAHLARTGPNGHSRRTARMRCPDAAVFRLSPPLVARPLTTLGHSQWPEPPRFADATASSPAAAEELTPSHDPTIRRPEHCGRVRAVRNSRSDVAACHRVVRRHTCSLVTRRSTRATQARAAPGAHAGQPAPKTPLEASYEARNEPEECLGSTMAGRS